MLRQPIKATRILSFAPTFRAAASYGANSECITPAAKTAEDFFKNERLVNIFFMVLRFNFVFSPAKYHIIIRLTNLRSSEK